MEESSALNLVKERLASLQDDPSLFCGGVQNQAAAAELGRLQQQLESLANVVDPLYSPVMNGRPVIGAVIRLVKRVIRRCTRWMVEPSLQQQATFNRVLSQEIGLLRRLVAGDSTENGREAQ